MAIIVITNTIVATTGIRKDRSIRTFGGTIKRVTAKRDVSATDSGAGPRLTCGWAIWA
jgi:hypothetical protein